MIFTSSGGEWYPAGGGIQCPHQPDLWVQTSLLSTIPWSVTGYAAPPGDEGLYVVFKALSDHEYEIKRAVWSTRFGWLSRAQASTSYGKFPLSGPPVFAPLGLMLGDFALGRSPSSEVAGWLADIFAYPAGILLALQVMES